MTFAVRPLTAADLPAAERILDHLVGGRHQVRMGESVDVLAVPGFVAESDGAVVGLVTSAVDADMGLAELTVLAVDVGHRDAGIGGALTEAVVAAAKGAGCTTVWLVTTNDNLDALRLYQRHGFRIVEVRAGAVDEARAVKPGIPSLGVAGIPMHDELVLERWLG